MSSVYPETLKTSRLILGQEQINDYMTNGYLRLGKILDESQIKFLQNEYDREIEKARRESYITNLAATDDDQTKAEDAQMLQVFGVSARNIWFRKLAHMDRILDVVEDLIGPNIAFFRLTCSLNLPIRGALSTGIRTISIISVFQRR